MADTEIEWADKVWNFVRGCRRVSPGCGGAAGVGGCYAESQANRFKGPGQPYEGLVTVGKQGPRWTGAGRFVAEKLAEPLSWRPRKDGRRLRVFVNSMSDLFFEEFSFEEIAAGFGVMAACPHVDFLVLTKRAGRMADWFHWLAAEARTFKGSPDASAEAEFCAHRAWLNGDVMIGEPVSRPWPLPNVWLGCSAEDQQRADERIPLLLKCPAAIRWVSAEPLIGPIGIRDQWLGFGDTEPLDCRIDWWVCGGESGPGARPCNTDWLHSIVQQCTDAGVAAFCKQLGSHVIQGGERRQKADRKGGNMHEFPHELRVREFPEPRP